MKTMVELYFRLLRLLIVLCMIGMVVMVFGNVVLRYAFNSGISVSEELARWLGDQGWSVERRGSRRGYRLLDVEAGSPGG